jgi:hypothetical protein
MVRTPKGGEVREEASLDRLIAKAVSKVGRLAPPWLLAPLTVGMTALFHYLWGSPPTVAWAVIGINAATAVLAALTWTVSQLSRGRLGRLHSTATVVLTGGYVTAGTITGVTQPAMVYVALVFGLALVISWNIRAVIRGDGGSDAGDPLDNLFDKAKEHAGFANMRARTHTVDDGRVGGKLALGAGDGTVEDLQKKIPQIEKDTGLPPRSLSIAADEDRADRAEAIVSNPRILRQVLPFPGPLHAGGSVADPLGLGLYQDMTRLELVFLEFHLMLMGTTGAGKSFGGAWNLLASLMARLDAVLLAADITKADQTLGDAAEALHWVAFNKAQAIAMLEAIRRAVGDRTAWLSAHGHKRWERGCGLKAIYVLLEEASDITDAFDTDEVMLPLLRTARSAGIFFIFSLQRASWTQFPTDLRALITGRMCFGVENEQEAAFCLPKKVIEAGACPEDWLSDYPGMCYLAAPGIRDAKKAMPVRTYLVHSKQMRQLAHRYPAAARPLDEVTARAFGELYANRVTPTQAIALVRRKAGIGGPADPSAPTHASGDSMGASPATPPAQPAPAQQATTSPAAGPATGVPAAGARPLVTAAQVVITAGLASAGVLVERLGIDPAHAERLLGLLEDHGVIGPPPDTDNDGDGSGEREVLVSEVEMASVLSALAAADADDAAVFNRYVTTAEPTAGLPADIDDDTLVAPPTPDEDLDWNHAGTTTGNTAGDTADTAQLRGKVDQQAARQILLRQLHTWQAEGRTQVATGDLLPVRQATGGYSRQWCQKMLTTLAANNVLRRDRVRNVYVFTGAPITAAALSGAAPDTDTAADATASA